MKALKTSLFGGLLLALSMTGQAPAGEIGRIDASFGEDGKVVTAPGIFQDQAYAVQVQPDGGILVAGSSSNGVNLDFALVRYTPDGELDPTFNLNGIVTTQVGADDDEIAAIALQDDGYIVAAGYAMNNGSRDFALARYAPDGQLDSSFGEGGIVVTEYGSLNDEITALAVDLEGRLVVAGYATGTSGRAVIAGRYLSSGAPDLSFGYNGLSLVGIGQDALARGIDLDDEGRIIVSGSYFHDDRTEAMVLRFTEDGELDPEFGLEGLAVPSSVDKPTDGYGVRVRDDGSIMIAGSTGGEGKLDTALFMFTGAGRPDDGFGDDGMLVISASQEDDMALAVDEDGGVVTLSGFAVVDGTREFMLISHGGESVLEDGVSFALKTGETMTGLRVNELWVTDSYRPYSDGSSQISPQTTIITTPFGTFSNDISYAVIVQPDGRAVAAGLTEENDVTSFAVARYATAQAIEDEFDTSSAGLSVSWLETKEPFEVTRTGAYSGGVIHDSGNSITKRGVVFSVAPDPVLKEGGTDTNPPSNGDGSGAPVISGDQTIQLPAGTTATTLQITTNEAATCRYDTTGGTSYDAMTRVFDTTGGTSHSEAVSGLQDGANNFFVRCQDLDGNSNTSDFQITVTVVSSVNAGGLRQVERYAGSIGSLLVGTAIAQDTTDTPDPTIGNTSLTVTRTDANFTASDSVFDLSSPEYALEGFTEDGSGTGAYTSILTGLKPGTFYYVRAYAITGDGKIYYGNQAGLKTADACFIATAAYGSLFHPYVGILRDFRDRYLLNNTPGDYLVRAYYRYSPPAAEYIAEHPAMRRLAQVGLLPVVGFGWLAVHYGASFLLLTATVVLLSGYAVRRSRRPARDQQNNDSIGK